MKRKPLTAISMLAVLLMIVLTAQAQITSKNDHFAFADPEPALLPLTGDADVRLSISPCVARTARTLTASATAPFDCAPCCSAATDAANVCMAAREKPCHCAALAYTACMNGGCGPCQCCAGWMDTFRVMDCNSIIDRKEKRSK